jgi:hypothetical protein
MQPEMPQTHRADRKWFIDLLASKGFFRSAPTTFYDRTSDELTLDEIERIAI